MLPIAVMPAAALLLRLGAPDILSIPVMVAAGSAIFDNLPILFAIGIAIGMSDDHRGEAVLAAVVGYYVLLGSLSALLIQFGYAAGDELVSRLSTNILLGLIAGLVAIWTYNRFRQVRLPILFRFFSGRKLVPILTSFFGLLIAFVLFLLWPLLWNGLASFNQTILAWGALGTAVYGFLNRLLLPIGLHHVLNTYFWFGLGEYSNPLTSQMVTGDIPRFLNGDPTAGAYQVGFYPIMMGGLLGAALAIILAAKEGRRLKVAGLIGSAALVSFITGITEPLEFAFLFVAPTLYAIHALLTAVSSFVTNTMGLRHGFGFSAGLIDYFLNFGLAERPIELAVVTAIFFLAYFLIFFPIIKIFNLKTPGREEQAKLTAVGEEVLDAVSEGDDEGIIQARAIFDALGGKQNVIAVNRKRDGFYIAVHDSSLADEPVLIALGADTVMKPSRTAVHLTLAASEGLVVAQLAKILAAEETGLDPDIPTASIGRVTIADPFAEARVKMFIDALGGKGNITTVESTAVTRLRVSLVDPLLINEDALRAAGA
jgi:PTS system N-acetylglucosamine-specific IIC component